VSVQCMSWMKIYYQKHIYIYIGILIDIGQCSLLKADGPNWKSFETRIVIPYRSHNQNVIDINKIK
jgi:hypothetical protein